MATQDINYMNNIDLALNQIKNVVVEVVTDLPTTVTAGRIVSKAGDLYIGKGDAYVKLGTSGDVSALAERVGALETTVGDAESGLVKDVDDLQTAVGDASSGLVKQVADIASAYATKVSATAGTGLKTTINSEGIVTSVTTAGTSDLSDWSTVDAGLVHTTDLIATSAGSADAGKAIKLNSSGKVDNSMIPPLAIAELAGTVDAKSKLTTLSNAEKGDIAKVEGDSTVNNNGVYFLTGAYDTLANWIQIVGPSNVVSVNGETGVVVLDASDVGAIDSSYGPETSISDSDAKIPTSKAVKTAVDGKVAKNADITGATKCKITYDAKGLVTAGADLAESDIPALSISKTTGLQTALDGKLDDSQLVTSFQTTTSDTNIPSEKLVKTYLDDKVDKVAGKGLSTEDFTTAEQTKLSGIATGAQVNVLEGITVNGSAVTPTDKVVALTIPVLKTASVTTTAGTDTTVTGVTAGKTPRCVQVYNSAGEVVMCYIKVASGSLTVNTSSAQTLTVAWFE